MSVAGALMILAVVGVLVCARARAALPAVFFVLVAVVAGLYTGPGEAVLNALIHLHVSTAATSTGGSR
jgi:hypothetical protein